VARVSGARRDHYEWGPAPYPAEQEDHWRVLSESFTDDHLDRVWRDDGDVGRILATAR
jgi:isoquinoline 1-oxidoreductase beta subunit